MSAVLRMEYEPTRIFYRSYYLLRTLQSARYVNRCRPRYCCRFAILDASSYNSRLGTKRDAVYTSRMGVRHQGRIRRCHDFPFHEKRRLVKESPSSARQPRRLFHNTLYLGLD